MMEYRIYVSYKLPDVLDVEAHDEDEAIEIVSEQLSEIVDLDYVEFEIEELDAHKLSKSGDIV